MKSAIIFLLFLGSVQLVNAQDEPLFTIVEEMPIYPGCESEETQLKKQECSSKSMKEFVEGKVDELDFEKVKKKSTVYVRFVIDAKGEIESAEVVRGIAERPDLDSASLKIIKSFPTFTPGKQRGVAVRLQYIIPVRFGKK